MMYKRFRRRISTVTEALVDRLGRYFGTGNGTFVAAVVQVVGKYGSESLPLGGSGVWGPYPEFDAHSFKGPEPSFFHSPAVPAR